MHIYVYMDVCIYNFLRIMINPIALEQIVISTLAELSKNLMISLSVQHKIIVSKLDATQCLMACYLSGLFKGIISESFW